MKSGPPFGLVVVLLVVVFVIATRNVPPGTKMSELFAGKTNQPTSYITNWDDHQPIGTNIEVRLVMRSATNFLTIEDCVFLSVNGTIVVNLTDAQWNIVTNHYAQHLRTNDLSFSR